MTGTLINVGTVLAGGGLGLLVGVRLPERLQRMAQAAVGLVTVLLGVQMALRTENVLLVLGSLLLGGLVGTLVDIEGALDRFGAWVERALFRGSAGRAARGFLAASLLFCVGPITVLGSFQDGLLGDYGLLATKAALDGVSAIVLAATLGPGVLLSAATVLVYQGGLTLSAGLLRPLLSDAMVREMSAVGGLIILALGLVLLELRQLPVANYLPALAVAPVLVALFG